MPSASQIAEALGNNNQRIGHDHRTVCPLCAGKLDIRDAPSGKLLVKCWGGCDSIDVYNELKRLGYLDGLLPPPSTEAVQHSQELERARQQRTFLKGKTMWDEGGPLRDTVADTYLRNRGIDIYSPFLTEQAAQVLRFNGKLRVFNNHFTPGLISRIDHVDHGLVAIGCTYLAIDGSAKAALQTPRKFFGPTKGGAVQLATPIPSQWLVIGEGIETTLSVMQSTELPGWAALSANGIKSLVLPPSVTNVMICADNDDNGVGQSAASHAAERFTAEGRRVRIALPPVGYDFNDVLLGKI